ncbi:phosphatidate cytidylyltransferase [Xanthomonadaceae bacterium JHOS43]|nr:phosphatidate cytidylyltransferase [Xanthomonadaceae bacterium JHOS43]
MKQRVITALLLAPLVLAGILWLPTAALMALVAAALLGGVWEWTRLVGIGSHSGRALILLAHAAPMAWLAWYGWPALFPWVALAGVVWWGLALLWLRFPAFGKAQSLANRALKLGVVALLVIPAWCAFALLHAESAAWALYGLMLVWAADTFAYFSGRRFGGAKLAPSISPGKTWAGFWGGLFGVVVLALAMAPVLGVAVAQLPAFVAISLVAGLASVLGDLFESLIKRHAGAKDSGALLPGHGGMLDRIDSILAALPVFAIFKAWFGL